MREEVENLLIRIDELPYNTDEQYAVRSILTDIAAWLQKLEETVLPLG